MSQITVSITEEIDEEHGLWPDGFHRSSGEDRFTLQFDRYCNGSKTNPLVKKGGCK